MSLPVDDRDAEGLSDKGRSSPTAKEWEAHYGAVTKSYSADSDWWTLLCWKEHLFSGLSQDLTGKVVADFGCGTSARIANIIPMSTHSYRYVGLDFSFDALKRAACNLPNGLFVRANVSSMCLRPGVADVVLCLGVLMYFRDYMRVLDEFLSVLRPGGFLLLHEQISRLSWSAALGSLFLDGDERLSKTYGVCWRELKSCLAERGTILHTHLGGSPIRRPLHKLIGFLRLELLKSIGLEADSLWCDSVGRLLPGLGAGEVQIVFQKA